VIAPFTRAVSALFFCRVLAKAAGAASGLFFLCFSISPLSYISDFTQLTEDHPSGFPDHTLPFFSFVSSVGPIVAEGAAKRCVRPSHPYPRDFGPAVVFASRPSVLPPFPLRCGLDAHGAYHLFCLPPVPRLCVCFQLTRFYTGVAKSLFRAPALLRCQTVERSSTSPSRRPPLVFSASPFVNPFFFFFFFGVPPLICFCSCASDVAPLDFSNVRCLLRIIVSPFFQGPPACPRSGFFFRPFCAKTVPAVKTGFPCTSCFFGGEAETAPSAGLSYNPASTSPSLPFFFLILFKPT